MNPERPQSLIEKELDTLYRQARAGEARGRRVGVARKCVAYGLKGIAGGGSLVVATGYFPEWHQMMGIAILSAIFLDSISSNHTRLLAEVQAGYAFGFLQEKVSRSYNRQLDAQLRQLRKPGITQNAAEAVEDVISALQQGTHATLTAGIAEIKERLAAADLKALQGLALDNEREAAQNRP
jgi:hypothetical protein